MDATLALIEIETLNSELEITCDALTAAASRGLALTSDSPVDGELVAHVFSEVLALCAFQDLAGQRLERLAKQISGAGDARPDAALLHGPANGDGLDQAAADALFAGR